MTNKMNGVTQLSVVGDELAVAGVRLVVLEVVGLEVVGALVVVLLVRGLELGELVAGGLAKTRLFHVAVYPFVHPLQ